MKTELSINKEIENYPDEDAFNFLIKANAIKSFFEYNVNTLIQNKMIALYGNWGSGKTSLMRHIEKQIDKTIYTPVFFEAWIHEKDDNLALSLCDLLTSKLEESNLAVITAFKKAALIMLRGFASGLTVKFGHNALGAEFEFDGKKTVEQIDEDISNSFSHSFYQNNERFKQKFQEIENKILEKFNAQRIIVFIDDLDRCEPENVLNLITALKLFFTYGQNTVFFCGLDQEAVTKAVRTRYQDVVKADEYLEKVFDVTFNMPRGGNLDKFLSIYFKGEFSDNLSNVSLIDDFFRSINFTNPRHIKKLLNKYQILKSFKNNKDMPEEVKGLIPDILERDGSGNVFETIFCLFFIILSESFPNELFEIEKYHDKMKQYIQPCISYHESNGVNIDREAIATSVIANLSIAKIKNIKLSGLFLDSSEGNFVKFLIFFSNSNPAHITVFKDRDADKYSDFFLGHDILTLFCKFLLKYKKEIKGTKYSNYVLWDYFNMVKYLL